MSDYLINFTDPAKLPFVVKPWTADGPISPSGLPLLPGAIAANTSLAIVGKGRFEYGENVQENLVRMVEHFAYSNAPSYPIEGQIWYNNSNNGELFLYDGTTWSAVVVSGKNTSSINFNNQVLQNIGVAGNVNDALNRVAANTYYLQLIGGTMSGMLTLFQDPSSPMHAATKQYVDNSISAVDSFVLKTGDTMTGSLTISSGNLILQSGMLVLQPGVQFDGGGAVLFNITDNTNPSSAVTRGYVNSIENKIADGNIINATYSGTTDAITFDCLNSPSINSNPIIANTVVDNNPLYKESQLRDDTFPASINIPQAVAILDKQTRRNSQRVRRYIQDGAYSALTTVTLPFFYQVQTDRLSVFKNTNTSVHKLMRNDRAEAYVDFNPYVDSGDAVLIPSDLYQYNMTVDGVLFSDIFVDMVQYSGGTRRELYLALKDSLNQPGYQTVSFSPSGSPTLPISASDITGYVAITYGCDFIIDGAAPIAVTFDGVADGITTIGDLIAWLNTSLDPYATANIYNGKIVIRSSTTGATSSVLLDEAPHANKIFTDLIDFTSLDVPVAGYTLVGTSGSQVVDYTGFVFQDDGSDPTSYSAAPYSASITIDDMRTFNITVDDGAASLPSVGDLITLLNTTMLGFAVASIENDSLVITSVSTGSTSTVAIIDSAIPSERLFENLIIGFGSPTILGIVQPATAGTNGVVLYEDYDNITFISPTTGNGSEITLAAPSTGVDIFTSPVNNTLSLTSTTITATGDRDYYEVGEAMSYSNRIVLIDSGHHSTELEVLLYPGSTLL